jgi:hypothetical protein
MPAEEYDNLSAGIPFLSEIMRFGCKKPAQF